MIQAGTRLEHIARLLDQAEQCTEAELSYEFNLLQTVSKLRSAQIREARDFAQQAQILARTDTERERAALIRSLLLEEFQEITLIPRAGLTEKVSVRIVSSDKSSLPSDAILKNVLTGPLAGFSEKAVVDSVESAAKRCEQAENLPFTFWLVRGDYVLNTSQKLMVRGLASGGSASQTYTVLPGLKTGPLTSIGVGGMGLTPFSPGHMQVGFLAVPGIAIFHAQPIYRQFLLVGELGYYPAAVRAPGSDCRLELEQYRSDSFFADPDSPQGFSDDDLRCSAIATLATDSSLVHNVQAGIGIGRRLFVTAHVPLILSVTLEGMYQSRGVFIKPESPPEADSMAAQPVALQRPVAQSTQALGEQAGAFLGWPGEGVDWMTVHTGLNLKGYYMFTRHADFSGAFMVALGSSVGRTIHITPAQISADPDASSTAVEEQQNQSLETYMGTVFGWRFQVGANVSF